MNGPLTATARPVPPSENPDYSQCDADHCETWIDVAKIFSHGKRFCSRNCAIADAHERGDEEEARILAGGGV